MPSVLDRVLERELKDALSRFEQALHQAGLDEKAFENALEKMIDDAFNDASMVSSSRSPGYDELRQIFRCAYYGTPVDF